jgi:NADH-quinone oxidoreductase subunit N
VTGLDPLTVAPFIALGGMAVVTMVVSTFSRSHLTVLGLTLAGIAGSLVTVALVAGSSHRRATVLLQMDDYALFFIGLLVATTGLVVLLSYGYLERTERDRAEYYVLMLLAALGAATLVASSHFASLFLGLEVLSVALYGLIAYPARRSVSVEAGLKYLVLAATTAAFLVLGMALVYAVTGTLALGSLAAFAVGVSGLQKALYVAGLVLIFTGVGFKLAVVPFHMWTPDVYQGAPAPVTAFVGTVSKGALFALLLRYVVQIDLAGSRPLFLVLSVVAFASMAVGNLLALLQQNIKRLLAYSSISHLGYLLVALLAGGPLARTAVAFYLAAYSLTMVGAFGVVAALSERDREPESLEDYRGLARRRPWLTGVFTLALLSLAGIPITAGFIGKFLLVDAGAGASRWALVVVLVLTSVIGLFYYLRVIVMMYGRAVSEPVEARQSRIVAPQEPGIDALTASVLAFLTLALLFLGLYPRLLLHLIQRLIPGLG